MLGIGRAVFGVLAQDGDAEELKGFVAGKRQERDCWVNGEGWEGEGVWGSHKP